jgi:hypothetical protein
MPAVARPAAALEPPAAADEAQGEAQLQAAAGRGPPAAAGHGPPAAAARARELPAAQDEAREGPPLAQGGRA